MLLLGIAGLMTSIACTAIYVTGRTSALGKTLAFATMAIGVAMGSTVGSVASGTGASEIHSASIGIIAGALLVIATLPLADGYTTTFRNFNVQTQKPRAMQLAVSGSEQVTVPAGTFDAYRVDVTSPDDGSKLTLWVSKSSRQALKGTLSSPQMAGATITSELQK